MENNQNQNIVKSKKEKNGSQVDRVILGKSEAKILAKWVQDFNIKTEGLVKISKADILNHLITSHEKSLSSEEVREIAGRFYDEARWLAWSLTKMKDAKRKGLSLLFDDLIRFRDDFLGKPVASLKKKKSPLINQISQAENVEGNGPFSELKNTEKSDV